MEEEIKAFEKTLIDLGCELTNFLQRYSYDDKGIKKSIDNYEIWFAKGINYFSLKKYGRDRYVLKFDFYHIEHETTNYKDMIDYLIKKYKEV